MRRTAVLLAIPAAITFVPAQPASAACVSSSSGVTACPAIYTCLPNGTVTVTVVGVGKGYASCGGATAGCISFRVSCTDTATTPSTGTLTCYATNTAVAVCAVAAAGT